MPRPRRLRSNVATNPFQANAFFHIPLKNIKKQPPEVFFKIGVLQNFTIFTGKDLCRSVFK